MSVYLKLKERESKNRENIIRVSGALIDCLTGELPEDARIGMFEGELNYNTAKYSLHYISDQRARKEICSSEGWRKFEKGGLAI
jgi:hypothetical protein